MELIDPGSRFLVWPVTHFTPGVWSWTREGASATPWSLFICATGGVVGLIQPSICFLPKDLSLVPLVFVDSWVCESTWSRYKNICFLDKIWILRGNRFALHVRAQLYIYVERWISLLINQLQRIEVKYLYPITSVNYIWPTFYSISKEHCLNSQFGLSAGSENDCSTSS